MNIRFYFAPLEGITLAPFRQVHQKFFPGVDTYYTPFLVANQTLHFKTGELRDVYPANNPGVPVIPQILTNKANEFVWGADFLYQMGYGEVNFNLGCPFPTVTSRGKGSGFLAFPDRLDAFFEEVFESLLKMGYKDPKISVKTRIGSENPEEARRLLDIYNRYPICELIVHPRVRTELYSGKVHMDMFAYMLENSSHPVCYNGDIRTREDYDQLTNAFPSLDRIMIGRGLVRDPSLVMQLKDRAEAVTNARLETYLREVFTGYKEIYPDERHIVSKMKELWYYMRDRFPGNEKAYKKLHKAVSREQYEAAAAVLLER